MCTCMCVSVKCCECECVGMFACVYFVCRVAESVCDRVRAPVFLGVCLCGGGVVI
jgi:hypothetical protein